jgi:hypothetical protein
MKTTSTGKPSGDRRLPRARWIIVATLLLVPFAEMTRLWILYEKRMVAIQEIFRLKGTLDFQAGQIPSRSFRQMLRINSDSYVFNNHLFDKVKAVKLGNTSTTDQNLACLRTLDSLVLLDLNNTQVTDAGLEYVKGLSKLTEVDLRGTQVTAVGVKDLKEALPHLTVKSK